MNLGLIHKRKVDRSSKQDTHSKLAGNISLKELEFVTIRGHVK